jgi:hypothetical protein
MLFKHGSRAGLDDFFDLRRQVLTDTGQFRDVLPLRNHGRNIPIEILQCPGGIAISPNTEWIGTFNFQQIRDFIEDCCDIGVVHRHNPLRLPQLLNNQAAITPFPYQLSKQ